MTRNGTSLLDRLVEHGVPEPAGRLYLASCRDGPLSASALARVSGLDRMMAYRSIRRLEAEGLLRPIRGRPTRYAALPPAELIDRWIRGAGDHLRRLEGERERLLAEWDEERTRPEVGEKRQFAILEGRATIQGWLRRQIGLARREILLVAGSQTLVRSIESGLDRALQEASARGVRIRLVAPIAASRLREAKHFDTFTELHHTPDPVGTRAVLIDRELCLVYVSGEEGLGATDAVQVALWSTAPSFVALAREYHHRLWARSQPAAGRFVELENPPRAELAIDPRNGSASFERLREIAELGMRASGVSALRLDLTEMIETVAGRLGRQIAAAVPGGSTAEVAEGLAEYYRTYALGRLETVKTRPYTLRVSQCFACTEQSPEIGRILCPKMLGTVFEARTGGAYSVSKPDPRRHADRGCRFVLTPA